MYLLIIGLYLIISGFAYKLSLKYIEREYNIIDNVDIFFAAFLSTLWPIALIIMIPGFIALGMDKIKNAVTK